jgi:hypothetical protein
MVRSLHRAMRSKYEKCELALTSADFIYLDADVAFRCDEAALRAGERQFVKENSSSGNRESCRNIEYWLFLERLNPPRRAWAGSMVLKLDFQRIG